MVRALVISGGGSKGAFAVGVIKKLAGQFTSLQFDVIVGTSTGSLVAPLALLQEYDLLEELYTTQKTENIILKDNIGNRLNQNSIFDANPLWNLIEKFLTDERINKILTGSQKIYLNTTCLQTSELVVFTNDSTAVNGKYYKVKQIKNADHFRRAVMASACQPVFMPPVKVNKAVPGDAEAELEFVDGGVREYAGIEIAINNNAAEIFTILLSPEGNDIVNKEYKTLFPILERTIDIFTLDVGKNDLIIPEIFNEALLYIDAVKRKMKRAGVPAAAIDNYFTVKGKDNPFEAKQPLKIYIIRPDAPLGGGPGGLVFDPAEMKTMLATGIKKCSDFIAGLPPGDITWA
jgi:NTE family protein